MSMTDDIRKNMAEKSTEDLLVIWRTNNKETWSDAAIEAVGQILQERGVQLPKQEVPPAVEVNQQDPVKQRKSTLRFRAALLLLIAVALIVLNNVLRMDGYVIQGYLRVFLDICLALFVIAGIACFVASAVVKTDKHASNQ